MNKTEGALMKLYLINKTGITAWWLHQQNEKKVYFIQQSRVDHDAVNWMWLD